MTRRWGDEFGGGLDWFDLHATSDPASKIADVNEVLLTSSSPLRPRDGIPR